MGGVREVCPVEYCDAPDVSCNMGYSYERCPYRAGSGPNVIPIANGSSVDEGGAIFVGGCRRGRGGERKRGGDGDADPGHDASPVCCLLPDI